jgi:serine/threonine-protein kinase RsbW
VGAPRALYNAMQMPTGPTSRCEFDPRELTVRFEFTISARVEAITPVVDGIMRLVREMGCAAGKEFEVETALREALANAILHGAKNDPSKQVQCTVACDETRGMLLVVRDPGQGFDPTSLPSPIQGQNIFSEHGRGLYLINQLMDDVRYERGGTEIHMVKR